MKNALLIFVFTFFSIEIHAQENISSSYDSLLANKLGADVYGMKTYVFANLVRGKVKIQDKTRATEIQKGHLENIRRLAAEGKLVLAGPFLDNTDVRGIFIFNVPTIEEAQVMIETDPAIIEGVLDMELRLWYGSAALMQITEIHNKISKTNP